MSAAPSLPEPAATLEAAQAGLLYERYSHRILGYCRRRLPSLEEAEDAVQHTFLNAYRSLRTGVVPRAEAAWLFKIAENVCRERRRSAWRRSRIEVVSDEEGMRDVAVAPEGSHDQLAGLADALAELTPNQRHAILLREWQGLSYREIAEQLDTSEAAVETLLFRARRSLARKLERTRDRVWSGLDLGSLLAWGKSLLGGTAVKIAAATVVVAAGVTVATPSLRHELVGGDSSPAKAPAPVAPAPLQALDPRGTGVGSGNVPGPSSARPGPEEAAGPGSIDALPPAPAPGETGSTSGTSSSGTNPGTDPPSVPRTDPVTIPVTEPVNVPPPPPLPVEVDVPPPPPLPVQVPPAPPLPPLTVPDVPSVPAPDVPELPLP